jgi:hypothetical protein
MMLRRAAFRRAPWEIFHMTNFIGRRVTALGLAGALSLAAIAPVSAAPVSGGASLLSALPNHAEHVRWRGRGAGWAAAGIAAGLTLGAIAASRPAYGYGPNYYYGGPAYAPAYAYPAPAYAYPAPVYVEPEPVYVAPPPAVYASPAPVYAQPVPDNGIRQCYVTTNPDRQLGYWRPC